MAPPLSAEVLRKVVSLTKRSLPSPVKEIAPPFSPVHALKKLFTTIAQGLLVDREITVPNEFVFLQPSRMLH
jgi:hypothetical protein